MRDFTKTKLDSKKKLKKKPHLNRLKEELMLMDLNLGLVVVEQLRINYSYIDKQDNFVHIISSNLSTSLKNIFVINKLFSKKINFLKPPKLCKEDIDLRVGGKFVENGEIL